MTMVGTGRAGRLHRSRCARAGVVHTHGREADRVAGQSRLPGPRGCPGRSAAKLHTVEDTSRLTFEFEPLKCTKCDLCVVLCPCNTREMGGGDKPKTPTLTQILDEDRCRYCGLCVEVCKPGSLTYGNSPR